MRVMIVVTHLLGTGHLSRALVLARAIDAAGHPTLLVSGGFPAPHLDLGGVALHQLPPVRSDGVQFTRLLDAESAPANDDYMAARKSALLDAFDAFSPDVLVTELFPFGRRVLREEFVALLERAQNRQNPPRVVASVRDILAPPSKPSKAKATDGLIEQFYDAVLVHSAAKITPLSVSWPVKPELKAKLFYTGYVAPAAAGPHPEALGEGRILVSVGGGAVGAPLLDIAQTAAGLDDTLRWHLLIGGKDAEAQSAKRLRGAPHRLTVEPARPDFRQMLFHAQASVSLCGYNTALDILQAGTPAVFVPFDEGGEVEQMLRARALAELPGIALLKASDLCPETLLATVRKVISAPSRPPLRSNVDGAARTVQILSELSQGGLNGN